MMSSSLDYNAIVKTAKIITPPTFFPRPHFSFPLLAHPHQLQPTFMTLGGATQIPGSRQKRWQPPLYRHASEDNHENTPAAASVWRLSYPALLTVISADTLPLVSIDFALDQATVGVLRSSRDYDYVTLIEMEENRDRNNTKN